MAGLRWVVAAVLAAGMLLTSFNVAYGLSPEPGWEENAKAMEARRRLAQQAADEAKARAAREAAANAAAAASVPTTAPEATTTTRPATRAAELRKLTEEVRTLEEEVKTLKEADGARGTADGPDRQGGRHCRGKRPRHAYGHAASGTGGCQIARCCVGDPIR